MPSPAPQYLTVKAPITVYPFQRDTGQTAQAMLILSLEQTLIVTDRRPHDRHFTGNNNIELVLSIDIRGNEYSNVSTWPQSIESQNCGPIQVSHQGVTSTHVDGSVRKIPFKVVNPSEELRIFLRPFIETLRPTPLIEGETYQIGTVNFKVINGVWNVKTPHGFEPLRHDGV